MQLYYLQADAYTGDADGPISMDLFVHAESPEQAQEFWKRYYDDWDDAETLRVWAVPTPALPGAVPWDSVTCTEFKV